MWVPQWQRRIFTDLTKEICSHIFQTIYSMCRLSSARQEEAASSGIVPLLKAVITGKSPLKQFALPIFCDLASAGKQSRRILWQNDGLRCEFANYGTVCRTSN